VNKIDLWAMFDNYRYVSSVKADCLETIEMTCFEETWKVPCVCTRAAAAPAAMTVAQLMLLNTLILIAS
jgi:hypothetical protein